MKLASLIIIIIACSATIFAIYPMIGECETCDDPEMKSKIDMLNTIQVLILMGMWIMVIRFTYKNNKMEIKNGSD